MKKDVVLLNFRISPSAKEFLTSSEIHKTPLYENEVEDYLIREENQRIRRELRKIDEEMLKEEKFIPKSRDLISKFKNI